MATREEASRIHVNATVRDDELERLDRMCEEAEPGAWVVKDGEVHRFGGEPLTSPGSLALMAAARDAIPRLLRGVRALESALRLAWDWERRLKLDRSDLEDRARAASLRAAEGRTGPDSDLEIIAELARLGRYAAAAPGAIVEDVRRWVGGEERSQELYFALDCARAAAARREEAAAAERAEVEALRATLRQWLARLEAGDVPPEVAAQVAKRRSTGG